ncbi:hypothetical protein BDV96DRAFT_592995 [Lophiotrema nucula]|uniref:Myb-like domain-containing protein n=1 Tax=Lophiotrema nucula TaxID=690887 RepID=A0A6A5ZVR7_9PLEO|nr:hypothetical protein BDV96DRAFT_592995 [Lophiotrema nucula]
MADVETVGCYPAGPKDAAAASEHDLEEALRSIDWAAVAEETREFLIDRDYGEGETKNDCGEGSEDECGTESEEDDEEEETDELATIITTFAHATSEEPGFSENKQVVSDYIRKEWQDWEKDELVALVEEGKTEKECVEAMTWRSPNAIKRQLHNLQSAQVIPMRRVSENSLFYIPARGRGWTRADDEELRHLWIDQGLNEHAIAVQLVRYPSNVGHRLNFLNLDKCPSRAAIQKEINRINDRMWSEAL